MENYICKSSGGGRRRVGEEVGIKRSTPNPSSFELATKSSICSAQSTKVKVSKLTCQIFRSTKIYCCKWYICQNIYSAYKFALIAKKFTQNQEIHL